MSVVKFISDFWPILLLVAVIVLGYVFIILIPKIRENKVKVKYQSLAEPKIFWQNSIVGGDYLAEYEKEKMRYVSAGNLLAAVQTPVIFFPRNAEFEFEWFGEIHRPSTVNLSEEQYMMAGVAFYKKMKIIWDTNLGIAYGTREMIRITQGQKKEVLSDDSDLW